MKGPSPRLLAALLATWTGAACPQIAAQTPRVDFVEPLDPQPLERSAEIIWFDDFDDDQPYLEPRPGGSDWRYSQSVKLGSQGRSLESFFPQGQRGVGGRKLVFGDAPFGQPVRRGESFQEVYWRYYVKYPSDWRGGGEAKQSRATIFNRPDAWSQASILHVWTAGEHLTLDPVRAVQDGRVVSTRYNDFDRFKWLGNSPRGRFTFHSGPELGRWVSVEVRWKLNQPGQSDGVAQLWVDGELDAERRGMDFRGSYDGRGINAIFLESYWNEGSPRDQYRWIDQFVVSTAPIGPIAVSVRSRVAPRLSPAATHWRLELVDSTDGQPVGRTEWRRAGEPATIGEAGGAALRTGSLYRCRVQEKAGADESAWSPAHWPVRVSAEPAS